VLSHRAAKMAKKCCRSGYKNDEKMLSQCDTKMTKKCCHIAMQKWRKGAVAPGIKMAKKCCHTAVQKWQGNPVAARHKNGKNNTPQKRRNPLSQRGQKQVRKVGSNGRAAQKWRKNPATPRYENEETTMSNHGIKKNSEQILLLRGARMAKKLCHTGVQK
jgi:hypothetical protein